MIKVRILGDSHSGLYFQNLEYSVSKGVHYEVTQVGGATALGAVNPNSRTNALNIFRKHYNAPEYDYIGVMLGEVDCGYLAWILGDDKVETIERSIRNLFMFIDEIPHPYKIVYGAPLPSIEDNTDKRFLAGARAKVTASLIERTELTLYYNDRLENICRDREIDYIDNSAKAVGKSGTVKKEYKNKNPYDHHLNSVLMNRDLTDELLERREKNI